MKHIVSISGGKDSTALYILMQQYHGNDFIPVFADTGHEHPVTVNYVRNLHIMANGPKVEIVKADFTNRIEAKKKRLLGLVMACDTVSQVKEIYRNLSKLKVTGKPFFDMMVWKGRAPSTKAQFCTEWLKLWPIKLWMCRNFKSEEVLMYVGIRRAESKARSTKEPFNMNTYFDVMEIRPMLYESESFMFELMEIAGVPPNPLYALGNNRVGCFPCIHSNKNQLSVLPEWAWNRLNYYEEVIGKSWFGPGTVPGVHVPTVQQVKEWCKTSRGGRNFDLFKQDVVEDAPSCFSTWHECE